MTTNSPFFSPAATWCAGLAQPWRCRHNATGCIVDDENSEVDAIAQSLFEPGKGRLLPGGLPKEAWGSPITASITARRRTSRLRLQRRPDVRAPCYQRLPRVGVWQGPPKMFLPPRRRHAFGSVGRGDAAARCRPLATNQPDSLRRL